MTTHHAAAATGLPISSHMLARALDDYLALTCIRPSPSIEIPAFEIPPAAQAIARLRQEASAEVERLLTLLDFLDGDPDLEPSYCGMTVGGGAQTAIQDECEDVSEDEGAQCDDEGAGRDQI